MFNNAPVKVNVPPIANNVLATLGLVLYRNAPDVAVATPVNIKLPINQLFVLEFILGLAVREKDIRISNKIVVDSFILAIDYRDFV